MAFQPTLEQIETVLADGDSIGWCAECGAEHDCIEPDAEHYHCTDCGAHEVRGAEEWLLHLDEPFLSHRAEGEE